MSVSRTLAVSFGLSLCLTPYANAQFLSLTNPSIKDSLCVGADCLVDEAGNPDYSELRLKANNTQVLFHDTSNPATSFASTRWALRANERVAFGKDAFHVVDITNGTLPFWIEANAPTHALYVEVGGDIGIGTDEPEAELHVVSNSSAKMRLETTALGGQIWEVGSTLAGFYIADISDFNTPFGIESGAPPNALYVDNDGNLGVGTNSPDGIFHSLGTGTQLAYMESFDGGAVQMRFRTDSENRRFLAVNNANEVKSQIIFKDNEILLTGQTDSGANRWLAIGPGGIVSQGPSCNPGPCDATFDREAFDVPSIEEHAAYMWKNQHLWAVGPTSPDAPFNLTQKAGGMLHELEVAHIYIEQLHSEIGQLRAEVDDLPELRRQLAEQAKLIARLESRLE